MNFLAVFLTLTAFWVRQKDGTYDCKSVTVIFSDEIFEGARVNGDPNQRALAFSFFNGEYKKVDTKDGYAHYVEQNKESGEPFAETKGAEIFYCKKSGRWVFTHSRIYKSESTDGGIGEGRDVHEEVSDIHLLCLVYFGRQKCLLSQSFTS